ncbi:MAG: monovalent cation/H+ antiporter subunit D [Alcanivorax sp.]|nr:monovalent cation/H+ antiporter subunit D [Alcanivorax sp.]MBM1142555.1 monovalent cation/H+ antiporter subunit D [Alcanivorax sp. ZXX171]MCQ6260516.1 monovalent cation/H+ antiporter subunit D [Alcanivorax sp. MM125-6]MAY09473.1 monovalent cation/H+ antiporter subunit D [Alcanivorax sp.]MBU59361.1 monovalent cation/H+ antiporter subunit D [Alcanivorax sp.]|tara:strand:- start:5332 stop:6813 length:1482 start_codon:yes stop_codon:yes gene_type:complete
MEHLIIAPILIPAFAGMLLLLEVRERQPLRRLTGLVSALALIPVAVGLYLRAAGGDILVYQLGDWAAPFGIVLVLDKLSALMVLLTSLLALPALIYASRADDKRGANFHALFQLQLMGINGAFLTGDLFNLFVFFEVLLIASYGLALHGRGPARVKAGIHYVVLNLIGSALFLVALGLVYGTTGTLNMADFAVKVRELDGGALELARIAGLLMWVVFGLKAALFPLYFWLPATYANATAGVAALFAIMTKVGVYAIARVQGLAFLDGPLAGLGRDALWVLALLTLLLAAIGVLGARRLGEMVAYLVVMSVGTLMAGLSWGSPEATGAMLYYLIHSTLVCGGLFLLADLVARGRGKLGDQLVAGPAPAGRSGLAALFFLGAIAVIGLPPLSGFMGKVALLQTVPSPLYWLFLLGGGLLALVGMSRAGSTLFWRATGDGRARRLDRPRLAATVLLLSAAPALAIWGEPVLEATVAAAAQWAQPGLYIEAVLGGGA